MIHIVVILEIKDPMAFEEFESQAIPLLRSHGGELISAFEPDSDISSESSNKEVHYLQFPSINEFNNYRADPQLQALAGLREKGILSTQLFVSGKLKEYPLLMRFTLR